MEMCASVLILDDDPSHLRIYGWVVEAAGYCPLPVLVPQTGLEIPETPVELVLLDHHLTGEVTAVQAVNMIRAKMPQVPILLLSEMMRVPEDVATLVDEVVRKGDPGKLVVAVQRLLRR